MDKLELMERIEAALADYTDGEVEMIVVAECLFYILSDILDYFEESLNKA